jgi:hypothetical protein
MRFKRPALILLLSPPLVACALGFFLTIDFLAELLRFSVMFAGWLILPAAVALGLSLYGLARLADRRTAPAMTALSLMISASYFGYAWNAARALAPEFYVQPTGQCQALALSAILDGAPEDLCRAARLRQVLLTSPALICGADDIVDCYVGVHRRIRAEAPFRATSAQALFTAAGLEITGKQLDAGRGKASLAWAVVQALLGGQ